jgi:hypothetical protein
MPARWAREGREERGLMRPGGWSSSTYANNPANAWNVNFNNGNANANNKSNDNHARLVRGGK